MNHLFLFHILILFIKCGFSYGVLYNVNINDTEYNKFPRLFSLEDYDSCLSEPDGLYCIVDFDLHSDEPSELFTTLQEYAADTKKHFNRTQLHRGVCVSKTCVGYTPNTTDYEIESILESCMNETIWREHKLQTKLKEVLYCHRPKEEPKRDGFDVFIAVVYITIIVLNALGTTYDHFLDKSSGSGNRYLLAFSLQRNWQKLVAPSGAGPDPRLERLKLFYGLRTMTLIGVIFSHTSLVMAFTFVNNPRYVEISYDDVSKQVLFNGNLVICTFFIMSSFLLAYNFEIHCEKHKATWWQLPRGIVHRWLRLTPTYALMMATIMTWMRYLGDGPVWSLIVQKEANACRNYWWAHILYINNYIYEDTECTPQTWYLAADTQLFILGLLLCVLMKTSRSRKVALAILLVFSIIIPAAHTYFQELDAIVVQSPETYRNLYAHDNTFRLMYIGGHTNLSSMVVGLAGGFLTYHIQAKEKDVSRFKLLRYRLVFWMTFPIALVVIYSGVLFYRDGEEPSTLLKVCYAATYRLVFQLLVLGAILGTIFKIENLYRSVIEWRGWSWTGRVSYSAFLIHTLVQRGLIGSFRTPVHLSDYYVGILLSATLFLTYCLAVVLWLTVEAPIGQVVKVVLSAPSRQLEKNVSNGLQRSKL